MTFITTATSFLVFLTLICLHPEPEEALGRRFLPLPPSPDIGCGIHYREGINSSDCHINHFPPPSPPASEFTTNPKSSLARPPSKNKSASSTHSYEESTPPVGQ